MDKKSQQPMGFALTAWHKARLKYYEIYGSKDVANRRLFLSGAMGWLTAAVLAFTINSMLPLQRPVPYEVRVADSGAVNTVKMQATRYEPGEAQVKYFLAKWVTKMLTLDAYLTERDNLEAYQFTRQKAVAEFEQWQQEERPTAQLKANPYLSRKVSFKTFNPIQDKAYLIRITTEQRNLGQEVVRKNLVMTVHYIVVPPEDEKELYFNPIGIYITDFSITEDYS